MAASAGFTLVSDLLIDIAQKIRPCPRVTLQRAYVRAVREWCRQTIWYGVNVDAVLTVGQDIYDINTLGQLEAINLDSVSLQPLPIGPGVSPIPLARGDSSAFVPDNEEGQPTAFDYLPEGAMIFNYPPDKAYPVTVRIICQPIIEASEIPTELTVKWQTAFEDGALSYLYDMSGEPFADKAEAERRRRLFMSRVNDGKADKQRNYKVGSVRAKPRPWITRGFGWRTR